MLLKLDDRNGNRTDGHIHCIKFSKKKKIQYITENVSDPDANRSIIQGSTYINNQLKLAC